MNGGIGIITIAELAVEVVRKNIKHVYIRVNRSDGRVRVTAPLYMDDHAIRLAVEPRVPWIRRQRERLAERQREQGHMMTTGETHFLQGRPYRLDVVERPGRASMEIIDDATVELRVRPGTSLSKRRAVLENWYREHLRGELADLVRKWEPIMGVEVSECRVKRMKTRWGSCNIGARRIWLNLELARRPR
jgi:predicted metal-dependent hydrolase